MLTIGEAPVHPQHVGRGAFTRFDEVVHPTPAPRFERTPASLRRPAPAAGEHSREVLLEWGVAAKTVDAILASGAGWQR